jgi:phage terminase large subunit-like protein
MDLSVEQQVALLPEEQQEAVLAGLDLDKLAYDWRWTGRPSQILPVQDDEPDSDFTVAFAMAGRGWGKTRTGGEWLRELDTNWANLERGDGHLRVALLGRTAGDVRDTMLEGPSGLLNIWPPSLVDQVRWIPSRRRVELPNGGICLCFSAEEPDQLRGPAFHISWADELASYRQRVGAGELTAWDNLRIATRLGKRPQILATTTPKRVPAIRKILADSASGDNGKIIIRRGRTSDNVHLSETYREVIFGLYEGTTLGRQELDGELLDEVQGAMVSQTIIDANRVDALPTGQQWIRIIGVDPSVAEKPRDECGIVVVFVNRTFPILRRHAFVVEDLSGRMSPANWGDRVARAAFKYQATVVAEINQGMGLVRQNVNQAAMAASVPPPNYVSVWSSKAKAVRAEPVGAAYEQGRIHHINRMPELEDQQTTYVAGETGYSPDRMDALVHACAAGLFPSAAAQGSTGVSAIYPTAQLQLDTRRQAALPRGRGSILGRRGMRTGV